MIPEVARRRLATFCDVFCEEGVFTVDESRRILRGAAANGMKLRVHADELAWTGGAELAAELGARSADHLLLRLRRRASRALAAAGMRGDAAAVGGASTCASAATRRRAR